MALQVAGSAVSPYAFSLSLSLTGGFSAVAVACLSATCVLLVAAFQAERPPEISAQFSRDHVQVKPAVPAAIKLLTVVLAYAPRGVSLKTRRSDVIASTSA